MEPQRRKRSVQQFSLKMERICSPSFSVSKWTEVLPNAADTYLGSRAEIGARFFPWGSLQLAPLAAQRGPLGRLGRVPGDVLQTQLCKLFSRRLLEVFFSLMANMRFHKLSTTCSNGTFLKCWVQTVACKITVPGGGRTGCSLTARLLNWCSTSCRRCWTGCS